MTVTINDTTMTSDQTAQTVRQVPTGHRCEVSWLPGHLLDRNAATTAISLADIAAERGLHEGHRLRSHIQGWAAQLGQTEHHVVARTSQPPDDIRGQQKQDSERPGPFVARDRR